MRVDWKENPLIPKVNPVEKTSSEGNPEDMVIAFDTTGSMTRYIGNVKKHVTQLIPKLFEVNPNLRISIVAFGDYYDMEDKNVFGKAYQCLPLCDDKKKIMDFIADARSTHGGDSAEFYELVIKKVVEETAWRENAKKAMLLIADAEPHDIGYSYPSERDYFSYNPKDKPKGYFVDNNQINWREEARKAASLGIQIDTVSIHKLPWLNELSAITGGVNSPFKNSDNTFELIETAIYARGGETTRAAFESKVSSYKASGDAELIGLASAYTKILNKVD